MAPEDLVVVVVAVSSRSRRHGRSRRRSCRRPPPFSVGTGLKALRCPGVVRGSQPRNLRLFGAVSGPPLWVGGFCSGCTPRDYRRSTLNSQPETHDLSILVCDGCPKCSLRVLVRRVCSFKCSGLEIRVCSARI